MSGFDTGVAEQASKRCDLPVQDVLWQVHLPEGGCEACNPLLKLVSLPRVASGCDNGNMHIAAHEVDDVTDHFAVMLHVSAVGIQCPISIKCDELQACC